MTDSVICRIAQEQETGQVKALWKQCFDDTEAFVEWYFSRYYRSEGTLGMFDEQQKLLASAQVIPYRIKLRGTDLSCGYIVGVDTALEARNRGYARTMLQECLQKQRREKQPISLLMPFEGQFYYRYGWPFCYFHQQIKIQAKELRCAAKPYGTIREENLFEAADALQRIYQSFMEHYEGFVCRDEKSWQMLLEDAALEQTHCFFLEKGENAEGYCLWTPVKDAVFIREMAWTNYKARAGLLQFLMDTVPENQTLWLELADDEALVYELAAAKTATVRYPFLMARIVDVKQCIEALRYPEYIEASFWFQVSDSFAAWNNGVFQITVSGGTARVESAEGADIDIMPAITVDITIEGLSQLVMGARSAKQLIRQGVLNVKPDDEKTVTELLQSLWPVQNLYINEYY